MQHSKKIQTGRSMIEMIAVLAIIGIITVGVIAGINQGFIKYRTTATYTEIRHISQNIANLYSWQRQYKDGDCTKTGTDIVSCPFLCENDVFLNGCEGNQPINPFGGSYYITFPQDEGGNHIIMRIQATGIPEEAACEELRLQHWGNYIASNEDTQLTQNPECRGDDTNGYTFLIEFY